VSKARQKRGIDEKEIDRVGRHTSNKKVVRPEVIIDVQIKYFEQFRESLRRD
jgi:hypothetical protein